MAVAARSPGDYAPAAGGRAIEALRAAAEPLRAVRVLHVTVAGAEGRVPEELGGLLPLAAGCGVQVEWRVLFGSPELRTVAAALGAGLRGSESAIAEGDRDAVLEGAERVGRSLRGDHDLVVLHDAALLLAPGLDCPAVWRCHEDASRAEGEALRLVAALAGACALVLVSDGPHAPELGQQPPVLTAAPGIDPLDPRNIEVEPRLPGRLVRPLGVDLDRPFCLQVLELDRWDDPHPAIEAHRLARRERPELQLVLAAVLEAAAGDDWRAAKEISDLTAGAEDVLLLTSYEGLGSLEVGALQLLARVVIERSLRPGFDLAPCEALWKRTPVLSGRSPVVRHGVDGFVTPGDADIAARLAELVADPGLAAELGRSGRERVRERFLVTSALERELRALAGTVTSA